MKKRRAMVWVLVLSLCLFQPTAVMAQAAMPESHVGYLEEAEDLGLLSASDYYESLTAAAAYMRNQMAARKTAFTLNLCSEEKDIAKILGELVSLAVEDDGTQTAQAGDYLKLNMKSYSTGAGSQYTKKNGKYYYDLNLEMAYFTTAGQENQVTAEVTRIANSLKQKATTDDRKIKAVYDYVCSHVSYDNSAESEGSMAHTAYNALFKKTAVCQGYASLMYRLLREMGLSVRSITGKSHGQDHAWNIVRLNGRWYNLDATWDSTYSPNGNYQKYQCFLKNTSDFTDHVRDPEYNTVAFNSRYPMSPVSYEKWQPYLAQVTGVRASAVSAAYVTLTWNKQNNAQGYRVFQYNPSNGTYFTVGTLNKNINSCKITGLKAGKSYRFIAASYHKDYGIGVYSTPFNVVTAPAKVNLTKLTTKSKQIIPVWKKVASGVGYQVQYSTTKNFTAKTTKSLNITKNSTVTKAVTKLKKGTRYYVRVRAYSKDGATKRYGTWSNVRNVVCK